MSASAILSVMTGTVLNGAAMTAASDNGTDTEAAMSGAFADMLNAFGASQDGADSETDSDTSAEAAIAMAPAPVVVTPPVPVNMVVNLSLAGDQADASLTDAEVETGEAVAETGFAPVPPTTPEAFGNSQAQAAEAAGAASNAVPTAGLVDAVNIDAPIVDELAPVDLSDLPEAPSAPVNGDTASDATPVHVAPRVDLPERLRNVPRKEELGLTQAPSDSAALEQFEPEGADIPLSDDGFSRDVEVVAERLTPRPSTLPQGTVTPLPTEAARKYTADGRLETDTTEEISLDTAGNAAVATDDAVRDTATDQARPSSAKPAANTAFETAIAAASTAPEGEVMETDAPRIEPTHTEEARPAEAKGSLLSQATLRTTAELAAVMIHRLGHRITRFDMVLTPETLGNVEVTIEVGADGQMSARLAFDNPQATQEMRARADELRRQLAESGFEVAENALEFTDRENDPRGGFNQFLSDGRSSRRAFAGAARLVQMADTPAVPVWTPQSHARTGVDMKV